jgi:hypothetical protein
MTDTPLSPIDIARANEELRQETATFEHNKRKANRWLLLRLIMGYSSVGILAFVVALCGYVIFNSTAFIPSTVALATSALLVDVLGLIAAVWRIVLSSREGTDLNPVTKRKK